MKINIINKITLLSLMILSITGCEPDKCTKVANKQKIKAGMTLKSLSSSLAKTSEFITHTRENPYWMDWDGRNINLDSLSGWYVSGMDINDINQTYYTSAWIGFQNSIIIPEGEELHMRSVNCVINGNIGGNGTLIFESYQVGRDYNSPIGAKLVVNGAIEDSVNVILNDNAEIEFSITLGDSEDIPWKITTDVPCSWDLPKTVSDENGVKWLYTEYDGTGIQNIANLNAGIL